MIFRNLWFPGTNKILILKLPEEKKQALFFFLFPFFERRRPYILELENVYVERISHLLYFT